MKELKYPFDSSYIIKKKRFLKRTLLSEDTKRIQKKIAILGGSTTGDIADITELFLLNYGIEPVFYQSEYGRYWQDGVFDNPDLEEFKPDIIFIHTSIRNIIRFPDVTLTREQTEEIFNAQTEHFVTLWESLKEKYGCIIIQNNFEKPYYRLMGNRDSWDYRGRVNFVSRLNMFFYDYASSHEGFYINDLDYVSSCYGLDKWSEPSYWHLYKYAMCVPAIPYFCFNLANIIKSIYGKNKKALVLDLDNTLWGGIVGDDGVDGIEIGMETHEGQVYTEFQKYLKEVKSTGVMLNVCSKNEEENALAGLNHPEGILKPDEFIVIKANWDPKDRNIEQIANELNIGLDALVFLDDNPAEREIVRAQIPAVAVPNMPAPEEYIKNVDRSGFFEITSFSADDLKRNDMYKENAERAKLSSKFTDYGEYLDSLSMQAVIDDFLPIYLPRITQLTNKSNQFNLTTKRFTEGEMEAVFKDNSYIRLYGKLSDKFGDNGIVSVVIGKQEGDTLDIILWLMSCRVLKRDMEYAMLDTLVKKAGERGIRTIKGYYYPTPKNKMVSLLYKDFGFELISEDESGNTLWSMAVEGYKNKNTHISVGGNE